MTVSQVIRVLPIAIGMYEPPKCSVRIRVSTTAFLAVNTGSPDSYRDVQSTNWEDNDWLFTCIGGRRLQVLPIIIGMLPRLNYGSTPKLESRACL